MEPSASPSDPPAKRRRPLIARPERGIGWAEGGRLTTRQRVVPVLALLVLLGALAYVLVPFTVAETVDCQGALRGSDPQSEIAPGAIVGDPRAACRDVGNSRLSLAGVVGVAALIIGAAGLFLPPDPEEQDEPDEELPEAEQG
ncbi:MAG: hypothetical protein M3N68_09945 [Actinomycetota bacterium]|nr:hypothetical protein [Actinomycetota bacterium]